MRREGSGAGMLACVLGLIALAILALTFGQLRAPAVDSCPGCGIPIESPSPWPSPSPSPSPYGFGQPSQP